MVDLRIYLLGSPHIELDGAALETDCNKDIALLAYGRQLFGLGMASVALGAYEQAETYYLSALSLARDLGSSFFISSVYDIFGYADFLLGNSEAAEDAYRESLVISQAVGDEHARGMALSNLADVKRTRGE